VDVSGRKRPYPPHDFGDDLDWIGLIQLPITVIQEQDLPQTKHLCGCKHFGLALPTKCLHSRILLLVARPASFSPRCDDQGGFNAFGSIPG